MRHHRLSMSRLWMAEAGCLWWARPDVDVPYEKPADAARFGQGFHGVAAGATVPESAAAEELDADEADQLRVMVDGWRQNGGDAAGWVSEVAFAYNAATGDARVLGRDIKRKYREHGAKSDEICGSADRLLVDGDVVHVRDWKTGSGAHLQPIAVNRQLQALGLAAARTYGATLVRIALDRVDDEGGIHSESAELDAFDLAETETWLQGVWRRLQGDPQPTPHEGCSWCPARTVCPETRASLVAMAPEDKRTRLPLVSSATDIQHEEHAGALVLMLKAAQSYSFKLEEVLREWAEQHGGKITMPDGRVYAQTKGDTRIEAIAALPILRDELGPDLAEVAAPRAVSRESIKEAIKAQLAREGQERGVEPIMRRVMGRLGGAGALVEGNPKWKAQRRAE